MLSCIQVELELYFSYLLSLYHKPKDSWDHFGVMSTEQKIFFLALFFFTFFASRSCFICCCSSSSRIWLPSLSNVEKAAVISWSAWPSLEKNRKRKLSKYRIILLILSSNRVGILTSECCFLLPVTNLIIPNGQDIVIQTYLEQEIKHLRKDNFFSVLICPDLS